MFVLKTAINRTRHATFHFNQDVQQMYVLTNLLQLYIFLIIIIRSNEFVVLLLQVKFPETFLHEAINQFQIIKPIIYSAQKFVFSNEEDKLNIDINVIILFELKM